MRHPAFTLIALTCAAPALLAQAPASSSSTAPGGRYVAIGGLTRQGTAAAPRFVLTDPRGEKPTVYRIQGETAQLAPHVGHTVEVAGALARPAMAGGQYVLRMSSLAWIASSCSTPAVKSGVRP